MRPRAFPEPLTSDEELVRALRRGELEAFDALYARYSRRLFGYLVRMTKDRAVAEDLFQEVLLEVLRNEALEIRDRRFAGWLFTVARNRALTYLRTVERRRDALVELAQTRTPEPDAMTPDELIDRRSRLEALKDALASLSESHQDALLLKEVGGLTYRQIAEIQAVPEGTAKSRLHFAIKAVRRALNGDDREL